MNTMQIPSCCRPSMPISPLFVKKYARSGQTAYLNSNNVSNALLLPLKTRPTLSPKSITGVPTNPLCNHSILCPVRGCKHRHPPTDTASQFSSHLKLTHPNTSTDSFPTSERLNPSIYHAILCPSFHVKPACITCGGDGHYRATCAHTKLRAAASCKNMPYMFAT